jgi:hypothetical protein
MSEEERKKILEKHREATKNQSLKKEELKKGVQSPKKDDEKKPS